MEFKATIAVHRAKSKAAILAGSIKACALNCPIALKPMAGGRVCNPEVISTCLRLLSCKVPIGEQWRMSTVVKLSQPVRFVGIPAE